MQACSWLPLFGSAIGQGPPCKWCDLGWKAEADPEGLTAGGGKLATLLTAGPQVLSVRGTKCHISVSATL